MQCWRCKAYGHRTGDKECPMRMSGNQKSEKLIQVSSSSCYKDNWYFQVKRRPYGQLLWCRGCEGRKGTKVCNSWIIGLLCREAERKKKQKKEKKDKKDKKPKHSRNRKLHSDEFHTRSGSVPIMVQPPTRALNHSPPSNPHLDELSSQLRMMLHIVPTQS